MTTSHQFLCRLMVEKVFNHGEYDLLYALVTPDAVNHELEIFGSAHSCGPEPVREFLEAFRSAFPDMRMVVTDQFGDGDRVATRWKMEGTQRRRLMSIEASHRFVSVEGIRIDRIVNGRIAETWNQWDVMGMLRQLGVVPVMERRPEMALPVAATSSAASVAA